MRDRCQSLIQSDHACVEISPDFYIFIEKYLELFIFLINIYVVLLNFVRMLLRVATVTFC